MATLLDSDGALRIVQYVLAVRCLEIGFVSRPPALRRDRLFELECGRISATLKSLQIKYGSAGQAWASW